MLRIRIFSVETLAALQLTNRRNYPVNIIKNYLKITHNLPLYKCIYIHFLFFVPTPHRSVTKS